MSMKRWEIDLMREILSLRTGRKIDFLAQTRTSSTQVTKYLQYLVAAGFLVEKTGPDGRSRVYTITPKGASLLEVLEDVLQLLRPEQEE